MDKSNLWPIALDAMMALGMQYVPMMDRAAKKAGVERDVWGLLLTASSFDPETISNAKLQVRTPYQEHTKRLADAAYRGLLTPVGEDEYRLTEAGKEIAQQVILAAYVRLDTLKPLRSPALHYLVVLLRQVVHASHVSPIPPDKWCITHSRRFDPGENASRLIQVDQYLSDLAAYRDDAHLAAWQPLGFDGPTWETLTLIWRGEIDTLDALHEKLSHRQYPRDTYKAALDSLAERTLVRGDSGGYRITPEGEKLCQKAEDLTDQYFYAPWDCLIEEDFEALRNLLILLTGGLT
ncbi:MAG: hypothetical protein KKD28_11255 [Chloroflexi bacterium]|nr:hypothetical protein [Chloroflexota bacterium]